MTSVSVRQAVKYGFVLLGKFILVFIAGLIIAFIGNFIVGAGLNTGGIVSLLFILIGGIIALIGAFIIYGGLIGVSYKMIADGVKAGVENSSGLGGGNGGENRPATSRSNRTTTTSSGSGRTTTSSGSDRTTTTSSGSDRTTTTSSGSDRDESDN